MATDSIFTSSSSGLRWVDQLSKTFEGHVSTIDIETLPCVFSVPKTLSALKPEAYAPQQIGLGPYHHLRRDLYKMESQKLAAVKKVLEPEQFNKFQHLVIDKLIKLEQTIRACYDNFLDHNIHVLAWIVAIDGLYLLHLLSTYQSQNKNEHTVDSSDRKSAQDIIMLENQIPAILLKEIWEGSHLSKDRGIIDILLLDNYLLFCKAHSPLKLSDKRKVQVHPKCMHLLEYMYNLIVNNEHIEEPQPHEQKEEELIKHIMHIRIAGAWDNSKESYKVYRSLGGMLPLGMDKPVSFMLSLPWDKLKALVGKGGQNDENNGVEEIDIATVSEFCNKAGVRFMLTPEAGGIRNIMFHEDERIFYLPAIKPNIDSEVILRNLVAFEAESGKPTSELADYVNLMCGMIDTIKDVDLLKKAAIIEGDFPPEEIVKLFNGIEKFIGKGDKKSDIGKNADKAKEDFDNAPKVKAYAFIKKYVYASWKFLTVLSAILLLLLLTLQSFCQVYGCSTRWFGKGSTESASALTRFG